MRQMFSAFRLASAAPSLPTNLLSSYETGQTFLGQHRTIALEAECKDCANNNPCGTAPVGQEILRAQEEILYAALGFSESGTTSLLGHFVP